jgi:hypothetical protein
MAAERFTFGPIYCEDSIALTSFPVEPVNTISNAAIVLFGVAALYYVTKRAPRSSDLYLLGALLLANGIGSALWHGLREAWALAFDVTPGLVFLFGFSFCWARRLWSVTAATRLFAAFFLATLVSGVLVAGAPRWVGLAPAVVVTGLLLIGQTAMRSRTAGMWGAAALASTMAALTFRTIELDLCSYIPFGTHFLWHIFNSAGAFMGIIALVTLQDAVAAARPPAAAAAQ